MTLTTKRRRQIENGLWMASPAWQESIRELLADSDHYRHKLDALLGALFCEDEATRKRIMAKAKELESGG